MASPCGCDVQTLAQIALVAALIFIAYSLFQKKSNADDQVYPYMMSLATGVPSYKVSQKEALNVALRATGNASVHNVLERIYGNSRISYRYMSIPDFTPAQAIDGDPLFYPPDGSYNVRIQDRMQRYREAATPLVTRVCLEAMQKAGVSPADIQKLIVVSSTGFLGPGLDCQLIVNLGLNRSVDRSLVGFMGCAAAMNGYRIGMDYVRSHPGKYALMCCVEISSVHSTFKDGVNDAIIHAIFGDGCAACVLAAAPKSRLPKGTLAIVDDHSWLLEGAEDGITLSVNDDGISCVLSKYLPNYIAKGLGGYVDTFLAKHKLSRENVDFWAVHPGGRRIIEEAQNGIGLTEEQAADSWAVLENYGNMLSPCVMFVLDRIFRRHQEAISRGEEGYKLGLAFSFSPGVGAEGIMLRAF